LFAFNMFVPLFPMDCARLLRSALSMRFNPQRVTHHLCVTGFVVAGVLLLSGLTFASGGAELRAYSILLPLLGIFGIQTCLSEMHFIRRAHVYSQPWHGRENFEALLRGLNHRLHRWNRAGRGPAVSTRPSRGPRARTSVSPAAPKLASPKSRAAIGAKSSASQPPSERERLQAEMERAVASENFTAAAELRDRIRSLPPEKTESQSPGAGPRKS
jgi:hypothetical protein